VSTEDLGGKEKGLKNGVGKDACAKGGLSINSLTRREVTPTQRRKGAEIQRGKEPVIKTKGTARLHHRRKEGGERRR